MEIACVARVAPACASTSTRERFAHHHVRSVSAPTTASGATTSGGRRARARATVERSTVLAMRRWRSRAGEAGPRSSVKARANLDDFDDASSDRDRASGRAKRRQKVRDDEDDEDDAAMREAFLDGAEIFALGTAAAVKARAAHVERKTAVAARAAGYVEHVPPRAVTSVWGDLPLYVAVISGAVLRRIGRSKDEVREASARGAPSSTRARLAALELSNDGIVELTRRTARDVSRLGTRVRLTRRELSPPLRKVQAETKESAQILAAVAERIELLEAELAQGQSTMSGLHTVSSKQFDVLSKAIAELKASQIELRAAVLASASAEADAVETDADLAPPVEIQSREYETVRASRGEKDDDDDDDDDEPIRARVDEPSSPFA